MKVSKVIGTLKARGRTHVQAVDEETGHPFHVGFAKKSPRNDILSDERINEIWAEAKRMGRA